MVYQEIEVIHKMDLSGIVEIFSMTLVDGSKGWKLYIVLE